MARMDRKGTAAWMALVVMVAVALPFLYWWLFYGGSPLFAGRDVAMILIVLVIILIALAVLKPRHKKTRRKKRPWWKGFEFYRKLPRAWSPPSIWRKSEHQSRKEAIEALRTDFEGLDALEFERLVIALLRKMGYDASIAPKRDSKLGGFAVNIIARKNGKITTVMTKSAHEGIVEKKDVVRLLRSKKRFKADRMLIASASAVSDAAYWAAKGKPLDIWNDSKLRKMVGIYLTK